MRDIKNYYGYVALMMDGYLVKPCICDDKNQRHYIVYRENYKYWEDEMKHKDDFFRVFHADDEFIHQWIPICKIYGYTDKFFELDEVNYIVQKWSRWKTFAGKSGVCLIDKKYYRTDEEPKTPAAWRIDFNNLTEDEFYEPHEHGYKLMDVKYKTVKEDK